LISELLERQIKSEIDFIDKNMESFVRHFFGEREYGVYDQMKYYVALQKTEIYVQKFWVDVDGDDCDDEAEICYKDYNKWWETVK